jgi:hypothetical protein
MCRYIVICLFFKLYLFSCDGMYIHIALSPSVRNFSHDLHVGILHFVKI